MYRAQVVIRGHYRTTISFEAVDNPERSAAIASCFLASEMDFEGVTPDEIEIVSYDAVDRRADGDTDSTLY